jgi:hypothetical protein
MNESQKALELRYVVDTKYERYARVVAEQLDHEVFTERVNAAGMHNTYWEEFKTRLRESPSDSCGALDDFVKDRCFTLLKELPAEERRVLWLGTDAADKAGPSPSLGSTYPNELTGELYDRVKDLALEEAEKEASFGDGFFQGRDILGQIRDVLAAIARRQDLNAETAASLRYLMAAVDSLPGEEPTEFLKLTLDYSVRFEDSGGSRFYTLVVSPESLELSLGGSEWRKEVGSDTWSGPRLLVESDGNCQEDGDVEEMLFEMLDVAGNPDYEISVTKED